MEAIAPRHALPSNATAHDLYSHWYPLYAKLHCLAAACEHMRRSCCPRRVESEVFMRECMCSCSRTYLGHQASPANIKGVSPRSTFIISASVLYSARSCANRMHTQFFTLQRCKLFARGLQWGPEATRLRSRLRMRGAYREMPTYGARLRARFAIFLGKANRCDYECLSSAATGLQEGYGLITKEM